MDDQLEPLENESVNDRNARSERFRRFLKRLNLPSHGAATQIAQKIGVTSPTVSSWIKGRCPRDPRTLFKFCDVYDVDPYYWVLGEERPIDKMNPERLLRAAERVSQVTQEKDLEYNMPQFVQMLCEVYNDPVAGDAFLERMSPFFKKQQSASVSPINQNTWNKEEVR